MAVLPLTEVIVPEPNTALESDSILMMFTLTALELVVANAPPSVT